jgi:hypothetical protein
MNIALEQTEEHVNGSVTNRYGDAFIRGNNGLFCCYLLCCYCLLTVFMHTQYSIYQLLNPYENHRLFLILLQCNVGVFMPKLSGSVYFTGHAFFD